MTVSESQAAHAHILTPAEGESTSQMWARAWQFTNNVCYDNAGMYAMIKKSGGQVCGPGVDCDKIIQRVAPYRIYDLVRNGGAPNAEPIFDDTHHTGKPTDFTDALAYSGEQPEPAPIPPPTPCPETFGYPDENTTGKAFQARVKQAYTDANRPFPDPNDQDAFRHFMRYGYSCRSMPEPQAADKHIAELRAQLGV